MGMFSILLLCLSGVPHIDSWEPLFTYSGYGWGVSVTACDVNEDGLCDLLFTGDYIDIDYYTNTGNDFVQLDTLMADGYNIDTFSC